MQVFFYTYKTKRKCWKREETKQINTFRNINGRNLVNLISSNRWIHSKMFIPCMLFRLQSMEYSVQLFFYTYIEPTKRSVEQKKKQSEMLLLERPHYLWLKFWTHLAPPLIDLRIFIARSIFKLYIHIKHTCPWAPDRLFGRLRGWLSFCFGLSKIQGYARE